MLLKQKQEPTKFIVDDEKSFQNFIDNKVSDITLYAFDEAQLEKKLALDLKILEYLSNQKDLRIEIKTNSPLILIALPILKKISGIEKIELTATRGKRPEEIIKSAKTLRSHKLPVKVKYFRK